MSLRSSCLLSKASMNLNLLCCKESRMDGERSTTKATEALCPRKKLIKILTEKYTICPLVLLQLNAYILSFHYNWNLVLMEVFGHNKTRLCLAIAFYSNAKDGVKYFKSLCPRNSTKCVCYFGEKFNRFYQSCINWKFNLLLTVCRFLPRSMIL